MTINFNGRYFIKQVKFKPGDELNITIFQLSAEYLF
jgi:protein involved in polysaccharide export with SLBB domain